MRIEGVVLVIRGWRSGGACGGGALHADRGMRCCVGWGAVVLWALRSDDYGGERYGCCSRIVITGSVRWWCCGVVEVEERMVVWRSEVVREGLVFTVAWRLVPYGVGIEGCGSDQGVGSSKTVKITMGAEMLELRVVGAYVLDVEMEPPAVGWVPALSLGAWWWRCGPELACPYGRKKMISLWRENSGQKLTFDLYITYLSSRLWKLKWKILFFINL